MEVAVGTGIGGVAVREGRPVSVSDHMLYDSGMPSSVHRALKGEGVVSILCAPLLQDGGPLGALYVGTRKPAKFSEASASLLSALAAQAAIAIKNARLYQTLSEKNETLEKTFTIHRLLTDASLSGAGMHKIVLELARLIERDVVLSLADPGGSRYLYSSHQIDGEGEELGPDEADPPGFGADIMAGRLAFGTLLAVGEAELDALQRNALEYGATVIALELVKAQSALDVEWRLQGELLEELLETSSPSEGLLLRAERQGVDVVRPRRVAVLQPGRGTAAASLLEIVRTTLRYSEHWRQGLVAQRGDRVIVAVPDDGHGAEPASFLSRLREPASDRTTSFVAGVSEARSDLRTALRDAESALVLALSTGVTDSIVRYEDLGPLRFMLDAPDTTQMVGLVRELLAPLAEHDEAKNSDLLRTLRTYLETGGHQPRTAERCFIHVSTLKYRLSQIAAVLDRPLSTPETRFELGLAFAVLQVLEIMGVDPFEA
jgi:DNA-binding PucR family transcriptional regulator